MASAAASSAWHVKEDPLLKKEKGTLRDGQDWFVVVDAHNAPLLDADGGAQRIAASTADAAARQAYRTFMRSAQGRTLAKKKWSSFTRPARSKDPLLAAQRARLTKEVDALVARTQSQVKSEQDTRGDGAGAGSITKMVAREFVAQCRPSFDRCKALRADPAAITDGEVDELLLHTNTRFWSTWERPLKEESDARFNFGLHMLVHVRREAAAAADDDDGSKAETEAEAEAEAEAESTAATPFDTYLCSMYRITAPSLLEFLQAIPYKTNVRKLPFDVATSLTSSREAQAKVKQLKQSMVSRNDPEPLKQL